MINKGAALALALALSPASTVTGEGSGTIVVWNRDILAATVAAGAQVYECVENAGRFICKFRELSALRSARETT